MAIYQSTRRSPTEVMLWSWGATWSAARRVLQRHASNRSPTSGNVVPLISWKWAIGSSLIVLCVVGEFLNYREGCPERLRTAAVLTKLGRSVVKSLIEASSSAKELLEAWKQAVEERKEALKAGSPSKKESFKTDQRSTTANTAASSLHSGEMINYTGSCQCEELTFRVRAPRHLMVQPGNVAANKLDYDRVEVPLTDLELSRGGHLLKTYRRPSAIGPQATAAFSFCSQCGVHLLQVSSPESKTIWINATCLRPVDGSASVSMDMVDMAVVSESDNSRSTRQRTPIRPDITRESTQGTPTNESAMSTASSFHQHGPLVGSDDPDEASVASSLSESVFPNSITGIGFSDSWDEKPVIADPVVRHKLQSFLGKHMKPSTPTTSSSTGDAEDFAEERLEPLKP